MTRLREWQAKINIDGELRRDEPLAEHTTFRVGGPADLYARPAHTEDLLTLLRFAREEQVPHFILGGGANILVSDRGVRGLVINLGAFNEIERNGTLLAVGAGASISDAAAFAADQGLAGLEFIYAMPGSVGGAVWMNARCYGGEIFGILRSVDTVTPDGATLLYKPDASEFAYKKSPFMTNRRIMTRVLFQLKPGNGDALWQEMRAHEADRKAKGHFAAPCAGSFFKNNRAFGRPSGAIIDSLGLRGFRIGGAAVSDQHANIVVNTGNASAKDIRKVTDHVHRLVLERLGYDLEREVLLVGDWEE